MNVIVTCIRCHQDHILTVDQEAYDKFLRREDYVQNLFPGMTADQRELLISQVCGTCFDQMFAEENFTPREQS